MISSIRCSGAAPAPRPASERHLNTTKLGVDKPSIRYIRAMSLSVSSSGSAGRSEKAVIEYGDLGLAVGGLQGDLVAGAPTAAGGQPEDEGPPLEAD